MTCCSVGTGPELHGERQSNQHQPPHDVVQIRLVRRELGDGVRIGVEHVAHRHVEQHRAEAQGLRATIAVRDVPVMPGVDLAHRPRLERAALRLLLARDALRDRLVAAADGHLVEAPIRHMVRIGGASSRVPRP